MAPPWTGFAIFSAIVVLWWFLTAHEEGWPEFWAGLAIFTLIALAAGGP